MGEATIELGELIGSQEQAIALVAEHLAEVPENEVMV